jgi:hypothetical protein
MAKRKDNTKVKTNMAKRKDNTRVKTNKAKRKDNTKVKNITEHYQTNLVHFNYWLMV